VAQAEVKLLPLPRDVRPVALAAMAADLFVCPRTFVGFAD